MYELYYDPKLEMVSLTLSGSLLYDDYQKAWHDALDLIEKNNCKRFLIDAQRHQEIPVENKVWFTQEFLDIAEKRLNTDVKVARIASKYMDNYNAAIEIFKYIKQKGYKFNLKLFLEYMEATDWLLLE